MVTHIRTLKRVHKLGQYSEVHFACVYLELSKGALYRKKRSIIGLN